MKFIYESKSQFINDAAQAMIENHLKWSGSDEGKPSKDLGRVRNMVNYAYFEANYTIAEYNALSAKDMQSEELFVDSLFEESARIADKKWEAAMILLGIE